MSDNDGDNVWIMDLLATHTDRSLQLTYAVVITTVMVA